MIWDSLYYIHPDEANLPYLFSYAPRKRIDTVQTVAVAERHTGNIPPRQMRDADAVFLLFSFVFIVFSCIVLRWKSYILHEIRHFFRTPKRTNLFIESNQNLTRVNYLLIPVWIILLAFHIYININQGFTINNEVHWILRMLAFCLLISVFYILKFALFNLLAFIFFTKDQKDIWNESYQSNLVLLGLFCFPLFLLTTYTNTFSKTLSITYLLLFLFFRITQIRKSFSIFIHNYSSLFYLILYLCAVEIIPAIFLVGGLNYLFYYIV